MRNLGRTWLRRPHPPLLPGSAGELFSQEAHQGPSQRLPWDQAGAGPFTGQCTWLTSTFLNNSLQMLPRVILIPSHCCDAAHTGREEGWDILVLNNPGAYRVPRAGSLEA